MEITKNTSITVTGVAGVSVLRRVDDAVVFCLSQVADDEWQVDEIRAIRDALTAVLDDSVTVNTFGPWRHLNDVPESIDRVYDKDGDATDRNANGSWGDDPDYWSERYGPFTLTRP
jgi:hypothetical protein